jgi:hypothetical protein
VIIEPIKNVRAKLLGLRQRKNSQSDTKIDFITSGTRLPTRSKHRRSIVAHSENNKKGQEGISVINIQ